MPPRDRLAYDLYSASLSMESVDSRFVTLVMAIEALLEPLPRERQVIAHVEHMIEATRDSSLPDEQIRSIVGTLGWLRKESIQQAGRRLVRERLGDRQYAGQSPGRFFTSCYKLRSDLVHGNEPRPPLAVVGEHIGVLDGFVGDLLSAELLDEVVDLAESSKRPGSR